MDVCLKFHYLNSVLLMFVCVCVYFSLFTVTVEANKSKQTGHVNYSNELGDGVTN